MDSRETRAQVALQTMRQWHWLRCDPDGMPVSPSIDLSLVVNRLAMSGLAAPQSAVLLLLSQGELIAKGSYRWRKYQWGKYFQLEDFDLISSKQWKTLELIILDEQTQFSNDEWPDKFVNLQKLQLADCPAYEWAFGDNRFTTALCPPDTAFYDSAYFEEWFSAWGIEVWPRVIDGEIPEWDSAPPTPPPSKGGRPLAEWWPDFVAELVAYTVDTGLPPGVGHQGQSDVIKEVSARLQERGKEEPSRSQIQEVVNAVLRRMRSAGN